MTRPKKDHIALPAQTLRRFRETGTDDFWYIDVSTGRIDHKGPSIYQKRRGYYQEDYDSQVRTLEDCLGKVADIVIPIAENHEQDAAYDREWLKNFAIALIAMQIHRRPELKDAAMETERLTELINALEASMCQLGIRNIEVINKAGKYREMLHSEKAKRDFFYERTDIRLPNIVEKLGLHTLGATLIKVPQEMKTTFLLTPYHFIPCGKAWLFTIAPRMAIALLPAERFDDRSSLCGIWEVDDEKTMDLLVLQGIKLAKQSKPPHLIGERFTLEKVKSRLQTRAEGDVTE
jgi:hypothetical protein